MHTEIAISAQRYLNARRDSYLCAEIAKCAQRELNARRDS